MSDQMARAFLEDILANPDDDTPRLVFADWLGEHGQEQRAEFIRVQVERARLPVWDARQVYLGLREGELLNAHGARWCAELPRLPGVEWGRFRRGFVGEATFAGFGSLRAGAPACWAAAPVGAAAVRWPRPADRADAIPPIPALRELEVTGNLLNPQEAAILADAPLLSTLRALLVFDGRLTVEALTRLAASPHLCKLEALRLPNNGLGNGAIGALAPLGRLAELDLSETSRHNPYVEGGFLDAAGLEELAGWPGLARLRSLNLSGHLVQRHGLRALLSSPFIAGLKEFVLRDAALGPEQADEFPAAREGLRLDALDLRENVLGEGAEALARATCLRDLKALNLARCELGPPAVRALARAAFLPGLLWLEASSNRFGPAGLRAALDAGPKRLHTLLVAHNDLGGEAAKALADWPGSASLLELDLSNNYLPVEAAEYLGNTRYLQNLLVLRVRHSFSSREVAEALKASPLGRRLSLLDLPAVGTDDIPF